MIRLNKWAGVLTSASPYILPAGASVEQINVQSLNPGQLTVRGGMVPVTSTGGRANGAAVIEMWGYSTGTNQTEIIFGFTDDGRIIQMAAPSIEYPDPVAP